jgi:hypothetical protein
VTTGRIVCLEGPSAVGKTTLAAALAREAGATIVPELDAGAAPPPAASAAWFVERHVETWSRARACAAAAALVVLDGDPLKGLWYNWVFAADGWPGPEVVAPLYRAHVRRGALGVPDLYVILRATEAELRARRAGDASRRRRGFERHLRLLAPIDRYFRALHAAAPAHVLLLDTTDRDTLTGRVLAALAALPPATLDALHVLDTMAAWVRGQAPDALDASGAG